MEKSRTTFWNFIFSSHFISAQINLSSTSLLQGLTTCHFIQLSDGPKEKKSSSSRWDSETSSMKKSISKKTLSISNATLMAKNTNSASNSLIQSNRINLNGAKLDLKWFWSLPKRIPKNLTGQDWPNRIKKRHTFNATGTSGSTKMKNKRRDTKDWQASTKAAWTVSMIQMTSKRWGRKSKECWMILMQKKKLSR